MTQYERPTEAVKVVLPKKMSASAQKYACTPGRRGRGVNFDIQTPNQPWI